MDTEFGVQLKHLKPIEASQRSSFDEEALLPEHDWPRL